MTTSKKPEVSACGTSCVSAIKNMRINHSRVSQVAQAIQTLIYPGSQDSLLLIVGPSGVGKTRLAKFVVEDELERSKTVLSQDAGIVPAIYVEADSSGEVEFSWRLFYQRILDELNGDFSVDSVDYGINPLTGRMECPKGPNRGTLASMRTAVERALKARGTKFLVIDEAAHIINQCSSTQMQRQLDTLKSLANRCGSQIILVGAYDLHKLMSLSAQLARRTHVIHFERYRRDSSQDLISFNSCLRIYEKKLPELWDGKLLPHAEDLYENTLGCIGTLSAVLTRALRFHVQGEPWSDVALGKALYANSQVDQMLAEILEGEAQINPSLSRTLKKVA
ncbi:MAG: AAA family ATPase [Comamonas sp.]|uniref:AAA family ATPase n=1 Tax=Comamonas sp. TaxID=34028 RepID=UPI002FCA1A64